PRARVGRDSITAWRGLVDFVTYNQISGSERLKTGGWTGTDAYFRANFGANLRGILWAAGFAHQATADSFGRWLTRRIFVRSRSQKLKV
ncbi:MAG: hypothetical protein VB065_07330, partial [Eubacteriales bacterium]|nr:hypothetical protein [Eubacteriales bacterium]